MSRDETLCSGDNAVIRVLAGSPYDVHIGRGLNDAIAARVTQLRARRAALIVQPTVAEAADSLAQSLIEQGIEPLVFPIPDAEDAKQLSVLGNLWDELGARKFTRQDVVIGIGGGAATDVAGFAAATWMRGIRVVQVPTSLLGMVDAAVGGKTGINTAAGKNLVGAFHEPAAVFVDLDHLRSLPEDELVGGSAEIIKCGFIGDPTILRYFEEDPHGCLQRSDRGALGELIARAIKVKATVVSADLKESGRREFLNYGHTFGHAVEQCEGYQWRHGNAVAVGMMFVAHLANARGLLSDELLELHRQILLSVGLPVSYSDTPFEELFQAMRSDKKVRDGTIRFVAISQPGNPVRIEDATNEELRAAYAKISA